MFLWREDRQADNSSAAFERYFSSENHKAREDRQLDALWKRLRFLRRASGVGFAFLLITLLVFWGDPGSLWDFFVDLGHY